MTNIWQLMPFLQGTIGTFDPSEGVPPISEAPPPPPNVVLPANTAASPDIVQGALSLPVAPGDVDLSQAPQEAPAALDGGELPVTGSLRPEEPDFKGRFGTRGVLRDILGTLGDAFLLQAGRDRIYEPQRQREREITAMQGFQNNPEEAIRWLSSDVGNNPELARQLWNDTQNRELRRTQIDSTNEDRQNRQEERETRRQEAVWRRTVSMLNGWSGKPEDWSRVRTEMLRMLERGRVDPETFMSIPAQYDAAVINQLRGSAINPYQSGTLANQVANVNSNIQTREDNVGVARQNAGTSSARTAETSRANRVREQQREEALRIQRDRLAQQGNRSGRRTGGGSSGGESRITNMPPAPRPGQPTSMRNSQGQIIDYRNGRWQLRR